MFVRTQLRFTGLCLSGRWQTQNSKTNQACRASTQVTTTTLQKNLMEKIKWYMVTLRKNMNNLFLTKHAYRKNIIHKKMLSTKKNIDKKIVYIKNLNNMS